LVEEQRLGTARGAAPEQLTGRAQPVRGARGLDQRLNLPLNLGQVARSAEAPLAYACLGFGRSPARRRYSPVPNWTDTTLWFSAATSALVRPTGYVFVA
jgi:hypothetical protein